MDMSTKPVSLVPSLGVANCEHTHAASQSTIGTVCPISRQTQVDHCHRVDLGSSRWCPTYISLPCASSFPLSSLHHSDPFVAGCPLRAKVLAPPSRGIRTSSRIPFLRTSTMARLGTMLSRVSAMSSSFLVRCSRLYAHICANQSRLRYVFHY